MDPTGQSLLKLLFNEEERICVSNNQFGYHCQSLKSVLDGTFTLVSPDESIPITYCDSSELTLVAINPINGWRRDENVYAFRSYLIEIDVGSIKEQLGYIDHLKMPFSAQIFSGNKSVHTVITLDEDLADEKIYRTIGDWILNIVSLADSACRNPSRSVRIPGVYREPGKKQRLIKINRRISHKELMDWLSRYEHLRPIAKEKKVLIGNPDCSRLSPWARAMLKNGIDFKRGRNLTWYSLAYDFALAGFSEDQTIEVLETKFNEERDFKRKEWLTAIGSAFKSVSEGK